MAAIYARRIQQGLMALSDVPKHWQAAVLLLLGGEANES